MAMWTVIIKNSSGGDITVTDLGITVADASQITFSDQFTHSEIQDSEDLRGYVATSDLVVNDGSSDLSAANGVAYLRDMNEYTHDDEVSTLTTNIGNAQTDIDNHTDGTSNQHDASEIDVEGTYTNLSTADLETVIGEIDTDLSAKVNKAGDTMTGTLDMGANKITSTYVPANDADLVNKLYADSIAAGFDPKESVRFATTEELTTTQAGSGVGATLTNAGTDAAFAQDSITAVQGDRVLVKDQDTNKDENGIYVVTTVGVAAEAEISTIDTTGVNVAGLTQGDYFVIWSGGDATEYNLWIDIDAAGTGAPSTSGTNVIVSVSTGGTDQDVSDAIVSALNGIGGTPFAASNASGTTQVVTATCNTAGATTDTADGVAATGFAFGNTNQGVTGVDWVLTRATDFDGSPANEVSGGAHTFVEQGTTNEGTGWVVVHDGDVTVDTDDIVWTQISGQTAITNLQQEVDNIETSLGSAIDTDGTYVGHSGTSYLDSATSFTSALELLDTTIAGHLNGGNNKHDASEIDVEGSYTYISTSDLETAIGDIDTELGNINTSLSGHLNGGASKHDASEIDVEGTYTYISTSDLETGLGDIDTELISIDGRLDTLEAYDHVVSLDDAYNNGTTITVDNGPVTLTAASGGDAPLQLTPQAALPTTNLADGQLAIKSGILCVYDGTRTKWLSVERKFIVFGRGGASRNQYLNFYVGSVSSNQSGLTMIRDATITGMAGQFETSGTGTFEVRKNDAATVIDSLVVTAATGAVENNSNVDVSASDYLQAFITATTPVQVPVFIVELAWRP